MTEFKVGDKVRSAMFYGVAEIMSLSVNARGRTVATVLLDGSITQPGNPDAIRQIATVDLLPPELPGYDLPFTVPRGNLAWITPALIEQVRADPRIGQEIRYRLDQVLAETAVDPDVWAEGIGEMGQFPAWVAAIRQTAADKGLL